MEQKSKDFNRLLLKSTPLEEKADLVVIARIGYFTGSLSENDKQVLNTWMELHGDNKEMLQPWIDLGKYADKLEKSNIQDIDECDDSQECNGPDFDELEKIRDRLFPK